MTADIRTAAQARAERIWRSHQCRPDGNECVECVFRQGAFIEGAEWAAARVTPTREQLKAAATRAWDDWWAHGVGKSYQEAMADAMLALMQELAEGESGAGSNSI